MTECGGIAGLPCPEGQFCSFPEGAQCGAADQLGICQVAPEACTGRFQPVCGCDGETHSNACFAAMAETSVLHDDECEVSPECWQDADCPVPACAYPDEDGDGTCDNDCPSPRCEAGQCVDY